MTARTKCGWLRECGELLYGERFSLRLKWAVYNIHLGPVIPYGSEACCLKESEIGILSRMERSTVRAMCGGQFKDRKNLRADVDFR